MILAAFTLLASCGAVATTTNSQETTVTTAKDSVTDQNSVTTAPPNATTFPDTTTEPPVTTKPNGLLTLPDSYYAEPGKVYDASKIVIPAAYNQGLAFDIQPVIEKGKVYFLLPSTVELRQVAYHLLDAKGNLTVGRCADFTDTRSTDGKRVKIFGEEYEIIAIRSDSPTLYLEIDEDYGTIEDVKADDSKETRAYGALVLECRADIAQKYGWVTRYTVTDTDPATPGAVSIKGRGNYTWLKTDKQGYSLKLEEKLDLLGMGKSKKWALVGNMTDPTMIRNTIAYYLSESAGLRYTPEGELVDFYVNGEYFGAFVLTEKVEIDSERLDIADLEKEIEALDPTESYGKQKTAKVNGLSIKYYDGVENPEDFTGGYIIEMEMSDRYKKEPCGFKTSEGNYYVLKSPEYASYEQVLYIGTLVQDMENALYNKNGTNPNTKKHYTQYIDIDSLVKKYLIDEIAKNFDGAKTSHYLYKPADSESEKLFVGPVWDYDIGFGIRVNTENPEGWYYSTANDADPKDFYKACLKHDDFMTAVKETYLETFAPAINTFLDTMLDAEVEKIRASLQMNDILWEQFTEKSFDAYVEELRSYLTKRNAWLTKELSK